MCGRNALTSEAPSNLNEAVLWYDMGYRWVLIENWMSPDKVIKTMGEDEPHALAIMTKLRNKEGGYLFRLSDTVAEMAAKEVRIIPEEIKEHWSYQVFENSFWGLNKFAEFIRLPSWWQPFKIIGAVIFLGLLFLVALTRQIWVRRDGYPRWTKRAP